MGESTDARRTTACTAEYGAYGRVRRYAPPYPSRAQQRFAGHPSARRRRSLSRHRSRRGGTWWGGGVLEFGALPRAMPQRWQAKPPRLMILTRERLIAQCVAACRQ